MRDGERVEFEWVFRSAYPSVLRTVYLILHDRGRAEEITQDAFLRLCERWRGVVRIDHPEAWVRQVAIRAAIRSAQRSRLLSLVSQVDDAVAWDRLPDLDLAHSVAALTPRQRAVVALYYLEDRPVDEVAHVLGVSTSTVKQHLFRARARLAWLMSEQREEVPRDVG